MGDELSRTHAFMTRAQARMCAALSCLTLLLACAPSEQINSTGNSDGSAAGDANLGVEPDWCAARSVLQAKCERCHQAPTQNGAPFPLVTYDDTQVVDRKGVARFQKMKAALESEYMPPTFLELEPAVESLQKAERDALLSWLSSDPPLDNPDCD
jgi:uncharacterized membrane protein